LTSIRRSGDGEGVREKEVEELEEVKEVKDGGEKIQHRGQGGAQRSTEKLEGKRTTRRRAR